MKVLVVDSFEPFAPDAIDDLSAALVHHLNTLSGVESELLRIPCRRGDAARQYADMGVCKALRLENVDRVIALAFPACFIPHPHKTLWLLHRPYEARATADAGADRGVDGVIRKETALCLAQCRACFAGSFALQRQTAKLGPAPVALLRPPLAEARISAAPAAGNDIAVSGALTPDRLAMLTAVLAHAKHVSRLVVVDNAPDPPSADDLRRMVAANNASGRIVVDSASREKDRTHPLMQGCVACLVLPSDGDWLGRHAAEALAAGKPVIAFTDDVASGEFVTDQETGRVVPPTVEAVADAMTSMVVDRARAIAMGEAGRALLAGMELNWTGVVDALLARSPALQRAATGPKRNDPCPCGSGKRFKHCHGRLA